PTPPRDARRPPDTPARSCVGRRAAARAIGFPVPRRRNPRKTTSVVTSERECTEAGASPARPRHCNGHCVAARATGCCTREGEPLARSQETSPFAPPADPSREGWWRCASRRRRSPISAPSGVGLFAMRRWAHRTHLAGLLLVATVACGRGNRSAPPSRISALDDAGRTVALAQPPSRIVSLSPAVTELLFALGVGDRLVGRTTWCDYPPAARQVPSVGDGLNPNIEAVAARHPDLVVLYRSALDETAAAQLARLGIAAALVRQDRLED